MQMSSKMSDQEYIEKLELENDQLDTIADLAADLLYDLAYDGYKEWFDSHTDLKNALVKMGYEIKC